MRGRKKKRDKQKERGERGGGVAKRERNRDAPRAKKNVKTFSHKKQRESR